MRQVRPVQVQKREAKPYRFVYCVWNFCLCLVEFRFKRVVNVNVWFQNTYIMN